MLTAALRSRENLEAYASTRENFFLQCRRSLSPVAPILFSGKRVRSFTYAEMFAAALPGAATLRLRQQDLRRKPCCSAQDASTAASREAEHHALRDTLQAEPRRGRSPQPRWKQRAPSRAEGCEANCDAKVERRES